MTEIFRRDGIAYLESTTLKEGDTVVTEGNERLFPGTLLMITQPEANPPMAE